MYVSDVTVQDIPEMAQRLVAWINTELEVKEHGAKSANAGDHHSLLNERARGVKFHYHAGRVLIQNGEVVGANCMPDPPRYIPDRTTYTDSCDCVRDRATGVTVIPCKKHAPFSERLRRRCQEFRDAAYKATVNCVGA